MKSFVDSVMNSSFNLVKRIPSKLMNVDDYIYDNSHKKENQISNHQTENMKNQNKQEKEMKLEIPRFGTIGRNGRAKLKQMFIDSFRTMVDFSIPPLNEDDPDYAEFSNDPKIPLLAAVSKIVHQTQIESIAYPGAIILLRRIFGEKGENRKISINNMHRLVTISLMVANKFVEDTPASNYDFALGSGFTNEAINSFEIEFVECLNYNIYFTEEECAAVLEEWHISIKD